MSAHYRICLLSLLVFVSTLLMPACNHDKAATIHSKEPTASTPSVTETVAPNELSTTTPEVTPPSEPVSTEPVEPKANDGLTLKPGQSGNVDASTTLHYVRMVNDSRCPADAQCIWAGEVTVELMLDCGQKKQNFTMKDDEKAASILGYTIELMSINQNHLLKVRVQKI